MYIESDPTQSNRLSVYQKQAEKLNKVRQEQAGAQAATTSASQEDSVKVSQEARLMAEANRAARDTGDVRQEKIAMLKEQVQNGTYTVDSRSIAEGMVREEMQLWA